MSNIKLHPSTLWTLRTKKKLPEKIKKVEKKNKRKVFSQNTTVFQFKKKKVTQLLTACSYSMRKQNMALCMCVQFVCKCGLNLLCMMLANYFSEHR